MTFRDLVDGTMQIRPDTILNARSGTGMRIIDNKVVAATGVKTKHFYNTIMSQHDPQAYTTILEFSGVEDPEDNAPDLDDNNCRVRCSCPDFYFTYGYWDKQNQALSGVPQTPYKRKTTTYPERNPGHIPGVCKHIIRVAIALRNQGYLKGGKWL